MNSLEEFTQAGVDLYHGIYRCNLTYEVDGRQLVYYSLQTRPELHGAYAVGSAYADNKKPYVADEISLTDFVGGLAYSLWQQDPSPSRAKNMPAEVAILTTAVELKAAQVLADINMAQAITYLSSREGDANRITALIAVEKESNARNVKAMLRTRFNDYVEMQKVR